MSKKENPLATGTLILGIIFGLVGLAAGYFIFNIFLSDIFILVITGAIAGGLLCGLIGAGLGYIFENIIRGSKEVTKSRSESYLDNIDKKKTEIDFSLSKKLPKKFEKEILADLVESFSFMENGTSVKISDIAKKYKLKESEMEKVIIYLLDKKKISGKYNAFKGVLTIEK